MTCNLKSHAFQTRPETRTCLPRKDMCCQPISSYYIEKRCNIESVNITTSNLRLVSLPGTAIAAGGNYAKFYIGDFQSVTYSWAAMSTSFPMAIVRGAGVSVVTDGEFVIDIPTGTTDFYLTVHMPTVNLILITPENSPMISFTDDEISMFMMLKYANKIAIDTSGLDHISPILPDLRIQHQLGPHRSSRAMAIVHIAIMDALIAIFGGFTPKVYTGSSPNASPQAAIAQALHDTLINLYPSHSTRLANILTEMLNTIPNGNSKTSGIALGAASAAAIITDRIGDGSGLTELYVGPGEYEPSGAFGEWTAPVGTVALGSQWGTYARPFTCPAPPGTISFPLPPAFNSPEYAVAFNQVKAIGGNGTTTPTARSPWETETGLYWAYDGTPSLCAPPRLYNQVAVKVLSEHITTFMDFAKSLTLVNVSMADTAVYAWYWKYYFKIWRPTSAIQDPASSTTNPSTPHDTTWTDYGAPHPNAPNFVPPFPAYPSGHASFGGSLFQVLRDEVGDVPFTFTSDELNGTIPGRPLAPRSFISLSQAEDENGFSRIPLGIHFIFDKTAGIQLGQDVADEVIGNTYQPV